MSDIVVNQLLQNLQNKINRAKKEGKTLTITNLDGTSLATITPCQENIVQMDYAQANLDAEDYPLLEDRIKINRRYY